MTTFNHCQNWKSTAKTEGVSNYQKRIGVLNSSLCISRGVGFDGMRITPEYPVIFYASNPSDCFVTFRGMTAGVVKDIPLYDIQWDALLFVFDTLGELSERFQSRVESQIVQDKIKQQQDANERSRRDTLFK